jgi:hypothetical protein
LNYLVRLTEQEPIDPSKPQSAQDIDKAKKMTQALQIIFNNVLIATMMCNGKSPKTFYLKDSIQAESPKELLGSLYRQYYEAHNRETLAPSVGLQLAVRVADGGNLFVMADTNVGWWHRSSYPRDLNDPHDLNKPIPLLRLEQDGTLTLAGLNIGRKREIPNDKKEEIKTALKRRTFHVAYRTNSKDMDEGMFVALC